MRGDGVEVCEFLGDSMTIASRHPAAAAGGAPAPPCPVILLRYWTVGILSMKMMN